MDTIEKGRAAEAAVVAAFAEAGLVVLIPFAGAAPYDLAIEHQGRVLRVQVKNGRVRDGLIRCNTCSTDHGRGRQTYHGVADLLAIWVRELRQTFVLSVENCPSRAISLRLVPPRNNQRLGVRYAAEHSVERWLARSSAAGPL